jgi:calcium-dependent protein kinase
MLSMRAEVVFKPQATWVGVSEAGKAFVKKLLHSDPSKRPTAKEVQCDEWIQVWARKSSKDEKPLDQTTVSALMEFKKCSDMKKLLSEVLSFTLMPEQIVDLRHEFEKIDTDGDGEISLHSLKKVLMQNAEALGTMTEREVEDLFDSIKVSKSETTIRWHEFLAAGLSRAKIDDRNLRLAFDRLDANRKG